MISARRFPLLALSLPLAVAVSACAADDDTSGTVAPSVASVATTVTSTTATTAGATSTTAVPVTSAAPPTAVQPEGFDLAPAEVTLASGDVCTLCLWVARTAAERQRGLMLVTDLGPADGMAFVYEDPTTGQFWMRNTPMPLSIAFFDERGRFISSIDMEPCVTGPPGDCALYSAGIPYLTAIEVPQGQLAELGIAPGSRLKLFSGPGCDAVGP